MERILRPHDECRAVDEPRQLEPPHHVPLPRDGHAAVAGRVPGAVFAEPVTYDSTGDALRDGRVCRTERGKRRGRRRERVRERFHAGSQGLLALGRKIDATFYEDQPFDRSGIHGCERQRDAGTEGVADQDEAPQPETGAQEPKSEKAPDADELATKLAQAEKKRDEYLAGWQRAKADFVNYKRDEMTRFEEISKYGIAELVREFVGVLDSFDLGIRAMEKQGPVEKGVYMIRSQVEDILKRWGLERIQAAAGKPFDPKTQEAIAEIESEHPQGTVVEEIEPGYRLYDKIIRPVRVKISKGPTSA